MNFWSTHHPPMSVLLSFDMFVNTLIWTPGDGWGQPDETLSARSGRLRYTHPLWRLLARTLDWLQPYHDQLAIEHDKLRALHTLKVEHTAQLADDKLIEDTERGG